MILVFGNVSYNLLNLFQIVNEAMEDTTNDDDQEIPKNVDDLREEISTLHQRIQGLEHQLQLVLTIQFSKVWYKF